jgi:acetyl esterase/lipase
VLLKYRVPGMKGPRSGPYPFSPAALEDAQRAMGLVRLHAAEWEIDPHRVGVLGFSAGGHLVAAISTHFERRLYARIDAADDQSCRPDFGVALYPGHLRLGATKWDAREFGKPLTIDTPERRARAKRGLNPDVPVSAKVPQTFLLQAQDDHVDNVGDALTYYTALNEAGVPAELHLFAHGGHAFGLRRTKEPITEWPQLVESWLRTIGILQGS